MILAQTATDAGISAADLVNALGSMSEDGFKALQSGKANGFAALNGQLGGRLEASAVSTTLGGERKPDSILKGFVQSIPFLAAPLVAPVAGAGAAIGTLAGAIKSGGNPLAAAAGGVAGYGAEQGIRAIGQMASKGPPIPGSGGGVAPPTPTTPTEIPPIPPVAGGGGPVAPGSGGGIGSFITKNAPLITSLAGTAANVYGATQQGKARDKELKLAEEEQRKRYELAQQQRRDDQIRMLLQMASQPFPNR